MRLRRGFLQLALVLSCFMVSACTGKTDLDKKSDKTTSIMPEKFINISEEEYQEIKEFMNYFMTFPVIWDFDQQDMSGAVDYFAQKWVWTDITGLEYDAEGKAFYVSASDFAEAMGRHFVMSDSALKLIDEKAMQGRYKICADAYQSWSWGFSFEIDQAEEKEGAYYVHGYNAEVTESLPHIGDEYIIGNKADPFVEFSAVIERDKKDRRLRLRELDGLKNGPGREVNVSEVSDDAMAELTEFAEVFSEDAVLEGFDINDLTGVFDFATQKISQKKPEVVRELEDGCLIIPLSELKEFMDQYFYLPKGYEKCLAKEGKGIFPCIAEDGVIFQKKEDADRYVLRADPPTVQNGKYYSYGVYNVNAETLRNELVSKGKDSVTIATVIQEQYPFELVTIKAVRGVDGKLRLLYFKPYYL